MLKRTPDLLKDWNIIWNKKVRECCIHADI